MIKSAGQFFDRALLMKARRPAVCDTADEAVCVTSALSGGFARAVAVDVVRLGRGK